MLLSHITKRFATLNWSKSVPLLSARLQEYPKSQLLNQAVTVTVSKLYYNTDAQDKKEFIMSILNSTATKREAKDYLRKYASGDRFNACIIVLQDMFGSGSNDSESCNGYGISNDLLTGFTSTVAKLKNLGINPIIIIDEKNDKKRSFHSAKLLDVKFARNNLNSCICPELLTKKNPLIDKTSEAINKPYRLSYPLYQTLLQENIIPIVEPIVYDENNSSMSLTCDLPNYVSVLVDLLSETSKYECTQNPEQKQLSIEKIFVLNKTGGIPSLDRNNFAHVFVNLHQEYAEIVNELNGEVARLESDSTSNTEEALQKRIQMTLNKTNLENKLDTYKQHLQNLNIMSHGLQNLPLSATGVIASLESCCSFEGEEYSAKKNPLLYNVLTDRSLISSSLPMFKKTQNDNEADTEWYEMSLTGDDKKNNVDPEESAYFYTTVLKKGVDVKLFTEKTLTQHNSLGLPQKYWIDESTSDKTNTNKKSTPKITETPQVGKSELKLDMHKFLKIINSSFNRELDLEHYLDRINGNIAMIIIVGDYEGIAILTYEPTSPNSSSDIEQFAYLDKFAVMPHLKGSLGISDVIFDIMFKKFGHELLWRSRKDNVVNKWYFQRSCGSVDLAIDFGNGDMQKDNIFRLFYYGDSKKFSDLKVLKNYAKYIRDIKPSWKK
ncbi:hypothetical protein ACO0QE_004085 [Hanseniaspora vineae]